MKKVLIAFIVTMGLVSSPSFARGGENWGAALAGGIVLGSVLTASAYNTPMYAQSPPVYVQAAPIYQYGPAYNAGYWVQGPVYYQAPAPVVYYNSGYYRR
jgi:hypothetical protein